MSAERGGEGRGGRTRRRIMTALCERRQTAKELAQEVGISSTAVRDHLVVLLDEGLVEYRVERRGPGKPTHAYHLTAEGVLRLSKGYLPVLSAVLTDVERSGGAPALEALLRGAGRMLATERAPAGRPLPARVRAAAGVLEAMGAMVEVGEEDGIVSLEARCCPLGLLTPSVPQVCKVFETMLGEMASAAVEEHCDRGTPPHCRFDFRERGR